MTRLGGALLARLRGRRRTPRVTVYTRQRCGLCRTAEHIVDDVAGGWAVIEHVDIDADETLTERYTVRVPVVAVDGEDVFEHQVDPATLRAHLRAAARAPAGTGRESPG